MDASRQRTGNNILPLFRLEAPSRGPTLRGRRRLGPTGGGPKIGIVSTMKNPVDLDVWLHAHRKLGVCHFFLRFECDTIPKGRDITFCRGYDIKETTTYTNIQDRQEKWVNKALELAASRGILFLIHIDSDEILHGDINSLIKLPKNIRTFWFQNYEAVFPKDHLENGKCFRAQKFINCDTGLCVAYANGKGGGRVAPDVSGWGVHRFQSTREKGESMFIPDITIRHFESCDFERYKEKFLRYSGERNEIPFQYYKKSIDAAMSGDDELVKNVYKKFRMMR